MIDRFLTPRLASYGVFLVILVLAIYAAIIAMSATAGRVPGQALVSQLGPVVFYLYALFVAGSAIRRIGTGKALRDLVSPLLRRMGWALFAGGITQVFLVPLLVRNGHGAVAFFDVSAMTLGAIGITLVILSGLVGAAERDRAELDEIV